MISPQSLDYHVNLMKRDVQSRMPRLSNTYMNSLFIPDRRLICDLIAHFDIKKDILFCVGIFLLEIWSRMLLDEAINEILAEGFSNHD